MALNTYSALKTAVAAWINRTDLTDNLADIITMAEALISADMSNSETMTVTESSINLAQGASSFTLPLAARGLRTLKCTSPDTKHVSVVTYEDLVSQTLLDPSATGAPDFAAIAGNGSAAGLLSVRVHPVADQAYVLEATYPAGLTALSDSNTSNFVLARAPTVYFTATMYEAYLFAQDPVNAQLWLNKYRLAMNNFLGQQWGNVKLRTELCATGGFNIYTGP
jgi:hypothetical protein